MHSQSAFTFLEMLTALFIATILAAIALPALHHVSDRAQEQVALGQLIQAIESAKITAETRRVPVSLCMSQDQLTCAGGWGNSHVVFIDENAEGVLHDASQIISIVQTPLKQAKIYVRTFPVYRNNLLFLPSGFLHEDNGTFWYCHDASPAWAVIINQSGRVRTAYPDKNGKMNDVSGKPLSC